MLKKLSAPQLAGVIAGVLAVLLIAGGVILFCVIRPSAPQPQPAATADMPQASADEANNPTSRNAVETTAVRRRSTPPTAPAALKSALKDGGCSLSALEACGARQLIVVRPDGSEATISFFEQTEKGWQQDTALSCEGYVGVNGTTSDMYEGGGAAPQGLFAVGSAFYQDEAPVTGLPAFAVTEDTFWIDDPDHPRYNSRYIGEDGRYYGEAMAEIPYYQYGFVINYNIPPTGYAKGSAIFFHISHDSPTQGCVTADKEMVLAYLAKLDARLSPYILIL